MGEIKNRKSRGQGAARLRLRRTVLPRPRNVDQPLHRRLGLDACLLKVSLLRFLQYCLRVCAACSTLAVES